MSTEVFVDISIATQLHRYLCNKQTMPKQAETVAQGHACCTQALSVDYVAAAEQSEKKIPSTGHFSETFNEIENKQWVSMITHVRSEALMLRNKPVR